MIIKHSQTNTLNLPLISKQLITQVNDKIQAITEMVRTGAPYGDGRARRYFPGTGAVRTTAAPGRTLRQRRYTGEA